MKFSPEFIEKVRDGNNIVDLIAQHTQLNSKGDNLMGLCPFPDHQEKTGSFSVSASKQLYYCFGCHKKGNIFTFAQEFMGLSFPEAIEFLAGRAHIALPTDAYESAQQDQQARRKKELVHISELTQQFFTEQFRKLPAVHPAKVYAEQKRDLDPDTLKDFRVGYAPEDWDALTKFLTSKNVSLPAAEEARVIKARKEGNGYFDVFRDRLMFPILNSRGEVIAFGGRVISTGEPKYLNSADTPIFTKGKILYGLSETAKYIRSVDQVIVVEGYMDLVSLYQAGIKNVVATMGTALTADHAKMLSRLTKNVVVLFDGDEAGQNASERSLPLLLSADLHPKGLILPEGQDPDDFVRSAGAQALQSLLNSAADLFSMVLGMWMRGYRSEASEKVKLSDQLIPIFNSIRDPRLKSLYVEEAAKRMGVDENWMRRAVSIPVGADKTRPFAPNSATPPKSSTVPEAAPAQPDLGGNQMISLKGAPRSEQVLLSLGLKNRSNFNKIIESGSIEELTHPGVRQVLEKAAVDYRQDPEKFDKLAGLLASFVDEPDLLFAYKEPEDFGAAEESAQEVEARLLSDCLKRIRDQHLQAQADQLMQEIRLKSATEPMNEKLEKLMSIQRERRNPTANTLGKKT